MGEEIFYFPMEGIPKRMIWAMGKSSGNNLLLICFILIKILYLIIVIAINPMKERIPSPSKPYIDVLLDMPFKKIFGTDPNKDILIAFLNAVFQGRKKIVDLSYKSTEKFGDHKKTGKAVFDLLCKGEQGEQFIIEVQRADQINFHKRAKYYTSRLISEQAPKGKSAEWNYAVTEPMKH